ncbi:hypothetical protein QEZ54_27875 [Catellatospora sp. KI3]|uniref:hypothetical protein n=1 Tax=Catellatospora sp. KI3 TaxID=3041620 RepID=UPI002482BCB4|nr:hypothetical protein [Catellatospora sp. KI3]MDI1464796.1 hypothetical protein [Catellatospora sp. KI3]
MRTGHGVSTGRGSIDDDSGPGGLPGRGGPVRAALAVLLAGAAMAGCTAGSADPAPSPQPSPLSVSWQPVSLPVPPGEPGRLMLRDATVCAGRWVLVGAVAEADGGTRPAAWTAPDGLAWQPLALRPKTFYGEQDVLYSVGCAGDRVAVLGAKSGGAHGNPRVSSWYSAADGSLVEVTAYMEVYGGNDAVNVARVRGGQLGFAIAGNRKSGAAVWLSPDATEFTLVDGVPGLASDDGGRTVANDVAATADGWLEVGALAPAGRIDRDPMAWTSADGRSWRRVPAPATTAYEEFGRVVVAGGVPVAVGLRGDVFGAWRLVGGAWQDGGGFGRTDGPTAWVAGLAAAGPGVLAAVSDAVEYRLWLSPEPGRWVPVALPGALAAKGEAAAGVAAAGRRVLLLADDGAAGRVWLAELPERVG